jgi:hypothetical protein
METIGIFLLLSCLFFALICYLSWVGWKDPDNPLNFNWITGKKRIKKNFILIIHLFS